MYRNAIEFLGKQRKTDQKEKKTPHPTWKNIIFCHFRSNQEVFIFSKIESIGGGFLLKRGKMTSLHIRETGTKHLTFIVYFILHIYVMFLNIHFRS
jgi:hypothetical protein